MLGRKRFGSTMAWEMRQNGGFYYYRSYKTGSTVKKEYLGRGPLAEAAAESDALAREARLLQRKADDQAVQVLEETSDATEKPVRALDDLCGLLVCAELEAAGYYNHRGEWRLLRGKKEKG